MRDTPGAATASSSRQLPRELIMVLGGAAALFVVIALGGLIASALPARAHTFWLLAACYVCPAAVGFVVYWWMAQRH